MVLLEAHKPLLCGVKVSLSTDAPALLHRLAESLSYANTLPDRLGLFTQTAERFPSDSVHGVYKLAMLI